MIIWKNISTLLMIDRSYKFFSQYNEYSQTEVMKVLKRDIRPISQVDSFSYIYIYKDRSWTNNYHEWLLSDGIFQFST